ncbi:MAG: polysaccharide pyruvyl transferase family protein [Oscillospiraceae bacterium]|nr:polysaccharide pyruvyl transferase family protein [Oscillospiraceae bacterium]
MIKVGILSMQRIYNYGSFLQAYGLKQMLIDLGCEVEFVDYHPGKCLVESSESVGFKRKISKITETLSYKASFKNKVKFLLYKKNYAGKHYPLLGITEKANYNPKIDLLVIGSDEVFNCVQSNSNVGFSLDLFGKNNNSQKLISYAASFGNTTIDKIEKYGIRDILSECLCKFDRISVRDNNSGNIVKKLTGNEPEYNLDPVLMYNYIGKCNKIPELSKKEKYLVLYGYSGRFTNKECKQIKEFSKQNNLKIYCIGGVQNACDKFVDCNAFEVISYFQNADYVITDTFHGTILSVITHRQFVSVVRRNGYGNSEKLVDLLERLSLNDREIADLSDISSMLLKKIDYCETDKTINIERKKAVDYLKDQIVGVNNDRK